MFTVWENEPVQVPDKHPLVKTYFIEDVPLGHSANNSLWAGHQTIHTAQVLHKLKG